MRGVIGASATSIQIPSATTLRSSSGRTSRFRVLGSNPDRSSPLAFDFPLASRLIVRNLSYSTTETSIQKEFSNFGQVAEVKLVKDEDGKRSKGYAFVQYTSQDHAMLALENMDHKLIDGRRVHVELAKMVNYAFGSYPRTSGPPKKQNS